MVYKNTHTLIDGSTYDLGIPLCEFRKFEKSIKLLTQLSNVSSYMAKLKLTKFYDILVT